MSWWSWNSGTASTDTGGYTGIGPQPYVFDPFASSTPAPTPEPTAAQAQQAVDAVQAQSGDAAALAVANALQEAKLSRRRKLLNTVLTIAVIALAATTVWVIYRSVKR